ncbi:ATPase family associated with various cellular activities (AAA) [Providencia rettgeri]|nr:ATPase family associated with various cellular activities (AAA) [Providencia rettgeri]
MSEQILKITPTLSTFEFLRQTNFVTSDDLQRMRNLLHERLRSLVSNPESAFNALWTALDYLGARMNSNSSFAMSQHRLTKNDIKSIIHSSGSMLVPPMNLTEILYSFTSTSAIGRSWKRDIAGHNITNPVIDQMIVAIESKKKSILLTGLPGSGKTCVMLGLQDALEKQAKICSNIVPLFIQTREFVDLATPEERQVQGLSKQWVEEAARLAESTHVVIVIDSLDVLSIAREHRVLQHFLAQIDRLLLIPSITVVTACRDFDRSYDKRIAERHWDCELKCEQLDWYAEVVPLLDSVGVATTSIDSVTRELICNPRELALFVELAQKGGSFNVVTSQELAQRYLDITVFNDSELGDTAIQAIEFIASEMLHSRCLTVARQRFPASPVIQRKLCSLNILKESQDGKLTFGHQTLLDVLVISRAIRDGVTLDEFINSLPPVPFVRPSIRSFISQLAQGERREYRKQLRAVLTGSAAFHIRRLVAESFAEQKPQAEDWPLIRTLREKNHDIFQVIYLMGRSIDWHYFWLNYLIPQLKAIQDVNGMVAHTHHISRWSNLDTNSVVSFWIEVLSLGWIVNCEISEQIGMYLSEIKAKNTSNVVALLEVLLERPQSEHSFLGKAIANCVMEGSASDIFLWRYIIRDVSDEDLLQYKLHNKLRCRPYEYGDKEENFLSQRMLQSPVLLESAINSIEYWSHIRSQRSSSHLGYRYGFLSNTSYEIIHTQRDNHHMDSLEFLFSAVEASILHNAKINSDWWQMNRERICFNHEGSLLYFGILACASSPQTNIDLIGRMLCDRNILEFKFTYELGRLIQSAFILFNNKIQDEVMMNILMLWDENESDDNDLFSLRKKAEYIVPIPCYLRSIELQAVLDEYEEKVGTLICQPHIHSQGGYVRAPFSYDIFLASSDAGVLQLLDHYDGHNKRDWNDYLTGGEEEVGRQLSEASSRHPSRFLNFLFDYWNEISFKFRDSIMRGVTTYLAYRYGNLNINGTWDVYEEPDASLLASQIIEELERHPIQWRNTNTTAQALQACASVIQDQQLAHRLIFLTIGFARFDEVDFFEEDSIDLINAGINMTKGHIVEALMILTNNFLDNGYKLPDLLAPTLRRFASDEHPAIRALILRRLPYLQNKNFELGWELFYLSMAVKNNCGLWKIAEQCLYYAYHSNFDIVSPLLKRLNCEGTGNDLETWGVISSLSVMTGHIDFDQFIEELNALDSTEAWNGAAAVWTNHKNMQQHKEQCIAGIKSGLNASKKHRINVAEQLNYVFDDKNDLILIPLDLIKLFFSVYEHDDNQAGKFSRIFRFHEWLNAISLQNPEQALEIAEIYLSYVNRNKIYLHDYNDSLTQMMTRLFAEAEEIEALDQGAMLRRVVMLQDILLTLGVSSIVEWLKAAERP